jgi:hypothetical protein
MSVETEAYRRLNSSREHIKSALDDIYEIVVAECEGINEFNDIFVDTLFEVHSDLVCIWRKIK